MKKLIVLIFVLFSASVSAEPIFKCKTANGRVFYQSKECQGQVEMEEIEIHTLDPDISVEAAKAQENEAEATENPTQEQGNVSVADTAKATAEKQVEPAQDDSLYFDGPDKIDSN